MWLVEQLEPEWPHVDSVLPQGCTLGGNTLALEADKVARLITLSCVTLVQSIHLSQTHWAPRMPTRPPTDKGQE